MTPSWVSREPASFIRRIGDVVRQALAAARVEAQFDRARDLVDVLPAGAGGADESLDDLALVDEQVADFFDGLPLAAFRASWSTLIQAGAPSEGDS